MLSTIIELEDQTIIMNVIIKQVNEVKRETQRHVITVLRVVCIQVRDRVLRLILYGFVMLSTII